MDLAQENAAGVELMTAKLRHQAAAGPPVKPPSAKLLDALVIQFAESGLHGAAIFRRYWFAPAIAVGQLIAMPQGPDMANVAQHPGVDEFHRLCIEQAVMALVANRQQSVAGVGRANHVFALADGAGHQLLAKNVLAGPQAVDGHGSVQVQWQGDDNHLDV